MPTSSTDTSYSLPFRQNKFISEKLPDLASPPGRFTACRRSSHAFVDVNCTAVRRDLIASDVIVTTRGPLQEQSSGPLGRLELGAGDTLFLDWRVSCTGDSDT